MPKVTTTDDPANPNVNEWEFNHRTAGTGGNDTSLIYADYYISKNLANPSITYKDASILDGVSPTSILPEEIKVTGNWENCFCSLKCFVVKTPLETRDLLQRYVGYIPRNTNLAGSVEVTVCMYDYYFQIEFSSGLNNDPINNKYIYHFHRGFSRHYRPIVGSLPAAWVGDTFNKNMLGAYEKRIQYGFSIQYKAPNRFDNIYSENNFIIEDANQVPPKKFLNIFESLRAPVRFLFDINFLNINTNYILNPNRNDGTMPAPPSDNNGNSRIPEGILVGVNYTSSTSFIQARGNQILFENTAGTNIIEKSDYALKLYAKYNAIDGRVRSGTVYRYQNSTATTAYSTAGGSGFQAVFYQVQNTRTPGESFMIQNKIGVSVGPATAPTTTSNTRNAFVSTFTSNAIPDPYTLNIYSLRYTIDTTVGSGYAIISDTPTSKNGARLYVRKLIRVNPQVFFYDSPYIYNTADPIGFLAYSPNSLNQRTGFNADGTRDCLPNQSSPPIFDFHNMKTCVILGITDRNTGILNQTVGTSEITERNVASYISNSNNPSKFYLNLMPRNFKNTFNKNDDPEDSPVFFRGLRKIAFKYNRIDIVPLKGVSKVNGPNELPVSSNISQTINLNSFRFLEYRIKLLTLSAGTVIKVPHRITIFEQQGNKIVEKYYNRSLDLTRTADAVGRLDLMLPDFPGALIDTTDSPYPRATSASYSEESEKSVYYGVGRVLRIDIHTGNSTIDSGKTVTFNTDSTNYDVNAVLNSVAISRLDTLSFNPSNGKDTNLLKIESGTEKYGRRFLLMSHEGKPEEETDIIFENNAIRLLTISEFVDRLNNFHNGLNCRKVELSNTAYATYLQGAHYFRGGFVNNGLVNISSFNKSTVSDANIPAANEIFYSDIFMGTYLDFPPYIQDFFQTNILDSWLTTKSRKSEISAEHLDLKCHANLRSTVFGTQNFRNEATAESGFVFSVTRANQVFLSQNNTETFKSISQFAPNSTTSYDLGGGFFRVANPYIFGPYDYTPSSGTNNFSNIIKLNTTPTSSDLVTNVAPYTQSIKLLPNKATRISFGLNRTYVENPYFKRVVPPPPNLDIYSYISCASNKLTQEIFITVSYARYSYIVGQSIPFDSNRDYGFVSAIYSPSLFQAYDFFPVTNNPSQPVFGSNVTVLNQNKINNNYNFLLLSEDFLTSGVSPPVAQSLIYSNSWANDRSLWFYYNNPLNYISKIFRRTRNNNYAISDTDQTIYCVGIFENAIILQYQTLDKILELKTTVQGLAPASNYAIAIDGPHNPSNFGSDLIANTLSDYDFTNRYDLWGSPTVVHISNDEQIVFYSRGMVVYYRFIKNKVPSSRKILFDFLSLFPGNNVANNSIINIQAKYNAETQKIGLVFITLPSLTAFPTLGTDIYYTESDYLYGDILPTSRFHQVTGTKLINDSRIFQQQVTNPQSLSLCQPAFFYYESQLDKGKVGILYKNTNAQLVLINIDPFNSTANPLNLFSLVPNP